MSTLPQFRFDNTFAAELEGLYVPWHGEAFPDPKLVQFNFALAQGLGLDAAALDSAEGASLFAGSALPGNATPLAQAYAGHQFGGFSPQLGDGRALLLGELLDPNGNRFDLQLKGSGRTPFSRGGDGKATLGPVLREYLIGEFMHAVGIPTTRSLAAITTGEMVLREGPQPGAVLARVASSHVRVGTFQFFAARGETDKLRRLADYVIKRHFPELAGSDTPYFDMLRSVVDRTASTIAKWMGVGFVHGVMNTDNTTVSGETIDYGPCAFLDDFDSAAVFSSIDRDGRYAYGNQPAMAMWNLARFAETLLGLMEPDDPKQAVAAATAAVEQFQPIYERLWLTEFRVKLGLPGTDAEGEQLVQDLQAAMSKHGVDFTQLFRGLAEALRGDEQPARDLIVAASEMGQWLDRWLAHQRQSTQASTPAERAAAMDRINPVYVPRNHKVEGALDAAIAGDLAPFRTLLELLLDPFQRVAHGESFAAPAPAGFGPYTTFCGT